MPDEQKKIIPINYTARDYESIRRELLTIVERFYPDTLQDFSEGSFGSLMLDAVSYVGDQLSFYLDYNVNEAFLDTAYQYDNILRHGRILGYRPKNGPSLYGEVEIFVMVPAAASGLGPDTRYIPLLKRGSTFTSTTRHSFVLLDNVDFKNPTNITIVAQVAEDTGAPTQYAIKATGKVVSGFFGQESIRAGSFERYKRLALRSANVAEILKVLDSQGEEYFEVEYLSQDIIFKEMPNSNYQQDNVPSVLKPTLVSRKFVLERNSRGQPILQFGSGQAGTTKVVAEPQEVAMDVFGKDYVSATTFDPTRLSQNENFGLVPHGTTLTVQFRGTNPINTNVGANSVVNIGSVNFEFDDATVLEEAKRLDVVRSVEVTNPQPIVGSVNQPNSSEVKRRIYDTFPTQNRAVTQADYESMAYRMPAKFGSIKRVSTQKDPNSQKRNLNMYVISEDTAGKLTTTNNTIKRNLKTWLNHYRMINDTIDILDPYIINVGIEFIVKPQINANKYEILNQCVDRLAKKYNTVYYIGEPLYISDIYNELKKITGVLDVIQVKLVSKTGENYSSIEYNIGQNLSPDGSYLIIPKNAIVEIKYPSVDIKGKVR